MTLLDYFKEEPMGAVNEMAAYLGICPSYMSLLIHGKRKPSATLAKKIEKATQGLIKREVLRPDIFLE